MALEIRPIASDEFPAFVRVAEAAFGDHPTDEDIESARRNFEFERSLAVFDEGRMVGTAGIYSFELTLPGLRFIPVAGISWIGVLPTHRRRGILTALMDRQLSDIRERGEALAVLLSSESLIYGRYGYGLATNTVTLEIDRRYAAFARAPKSTGTVSLIDQEQARSVLPEVFDRARRLQPGQLNQRPGRWERWFLDEARWRRGFSQRFYAIYESGPGEIDGYVSYRMKSEWPGGLATSVLRIADLVDLTPAAHAALWEFCLGMDLVTTVEAPNRPIDEPVRWMLADPRRLRFQHFGDFLWARLVDIPAALEARCYAMPGNLVFEVTDPFCPANSGCYDLEAGSDGARCGRTDRSPDLSLEVADLGATYLGGVRFSTLARAGRVRELSVGSLQRADAMFASYPAPWCSVDF